ncbi:MAG: lipopolysaccharide transport periplasmic protein LptA, partial [Pseudohongiellaceae bacterium]
YYGEPGLPAELSQGSLKITGMEIEILRRDGEVDRIIARGAPATFEQQPAIDQAIVYANGFTLVYDNSAQLLTLDEEAELIQQDATVSGHRIEYDMAAKTVTGTSKNAEERMRMVIPPQNRPE